MLGILTGALCAIAIDLKFKLGFDDSLDVVGVHLVGGIVGTLFIGFFAYQTSPAHPGGVGLIYGGGFGQLGIQALAAVVVMAYSFALAFAIGWVIQKTMGFRVTNEDEIAGIDTAVHGEEGYVLLDERV